jgi:hypothetical protein
VSAPEGLAPVPDGGYLIYSNYTLIGGPEATLAAAKRRAVAESRSYDDLVVIERGGQNLYLARYGQLYRLVATR